MTSGTLWALESEDLRGILRSEFSNLSSLKLLRSVDFLSRLTILSRVTLQTHFPKFPFDADLLRNPNVSRLNFDNLKENDNSQDSPEFSLEKTEGSYFGE